MRKGDVRFRLYADGMVVHEDDFEERDLMQPFVDDYTTYHIAEEILEYLAIEQEKEKCSFCGKHKKGRMVAGDGVGICFECIKIKKEELDKGGKG